MDDCIDMKVFGKKQHEQNYVYTFNCISLSSSMKWPYKVIDDLGLDCFSN